MFSCLIYSKTSTRETTCGFNLFGVCWMDLCRKGLCLKDPAFVALALWPDDTIRKNSVESLGPVRNTFGLLINYRNQSVTKMQFSAFLIAPHSAT